MTRNLKEAFRNLIVDGSKGFKWGAIAGVLYSGAVSFLSNFKEVHNVKIPEFRESEEYAAKKFKAVTQQAIFCNGAASDTNNLGCSVIDFVTKKNEAYEVKNYDLENGLNSLIHVLKKQIGERVNNLPEGYTQKIVLDVRGRGYSKEFIEECISKIQNSLNDIYPNIEIEVIKDGLLPL